MLLSVEQIYIVRLIICPFGNLWSCLERRMLNSSFYFADRFTVISFLEALEDTVAKSSETETSSMAKDAMDES
jgi:hypothetical protein